jgi:uncharacterized protein (DUF1778 family)
MGRRNNHTNKLKEFLATSALTETEARKAYWRAYKAQWRRKKRKEHKEYTISYSPHELYIITQAAKAHKRSVTSFIKNAALAYTTKKFLVPDADAVAQVRELLGLTYTRIQAITEDERLSEKTGNLLMAKLNNIETAVLSILTKPREK